ncbi:MAG: hypothetical protein ABI703_11825 [Gemmatimonadales bacterium]
MAQHTWEALKQPLRAQLRRLSLQVDAGAVRLCAALLSLDLFFIAVFAAHRFYTVVYNDGTPVLGDRWHIGRDGSFAEAVGYVKAAIVVSLLILIPGKRGRPIYLGLALVYTVALLDDALQLHERVGHGLADDLGLQYFVGRMSPHVGELMVWAALAVFLVAAVRAGFARSPADDRSRGLLLLGAFAVLVLFAVVVDLVHVVVKYWLNFRTADFLFTLVEEGGEQITLTLTCGLALLIYREAVHRELA